MKMSPATVPRHAPTPKGARTAARILEAATTVLGRDGFGGATLGRIADEAGIDKRGVLYHFGTREELLVRVVQTVGERVAANIEARAEAATQDHGPAAAVQVLWDGITSEETLLRAYFALIGGSPDGGEVAEALRALDDTYRRVVARQLRLTGFHPDLPFVLLRGMLLEWIQYGDGPAIDAGLRELKLLSQATKAKAS